MSLQIVILAAGMGTRMKSNRPKVLHHLGGEPLLAHVLNTAESIQAEKICVVYGHGGEQLREAFAQREIEWVLQEQQLGTGHAVAQALPYLLPDLPVLVLYGDVPLIRVETLQNLGSLVSEESLGLLTVTLPDPSGYGRIVRDDAGEVVAIVEQKDASTEQLNNSEVNTGIVALPAGRINRWLNSLGNDNAQGEYYLTDVIAMANSEGVSIETAQPEHEWEVLGVNSQRQLAELERIFQFNNVLDLAEAGVCFADLNRVDIRGSVEAGRDVRIDINTVFEGNVVLGDGVEIGPNCVIRDSTLEAEAVIHANSLVEQAQVGPNASVGPFARLRPGAKLLADSRVGNFVEVKNAIVGEGSKVNHLAYVGDAELGKSVNIGAGAITCNYDGVNKHRTEIADEAFVGSNTALIAPVKVGKGANVGAGSTISKDVPEGGLTVARARQKTVENWKRPKK